MKICSKCGEEKEYREFYKIVRGVGGVRGECKKCCNKKSNKYHKENREIDLVRMKNYRESHKEERKEYCKNNAEKLRANHSKWRKSNPNKKQAQGFARTALFNGKIKKQEFCSKCGSDYLVQMHHEDYTKPLDVVFLCKYCHMQRHQELKEI